MATVVAFPSKVTISRNLIQINSCCIVNHQLSYFKRFSAAIYNKFQQDFSFFFCKTNELVKNIRKLYSTFCVKKVLKL